MAESGDECGLGEDEGAGDPGDVIEGVELGEDLRERSGENGLVECDEEYAQLYGFLISTYNSRLN